ncbi:hypothetical protein VDGD_03394 [Verticillium dahliae]|nr:hypothetical protein VDGD_03394 [Verticillium dahliae]
MASARTSSLSPGHIKNIANRPAIHRRYPSLPSARNPRRAAPRRRPPPRRDGDNRGTAIVVKVGGSLFTLSRLQGLVDSAHTNGKIPRRVVLPRDSLAAAAMVERWKDVILETRQAELEAAFKAITEAEETAASAEAIAQASTDDAPQAKRPFLWATARTRGSSVWRPVETTTASGRVKKFLRKVPVKPVFESPAHTIPVAPNMPVGKPVSEQPVCPPLFPETLATETPTVQVTAPKTWTAKTLAVKGTNPTPAALPEATQVLDLVTPTIPKPASKTTVDRAERPSQAKIKPLVLKPFNNDWLTKKKPASKAPAQQPASSTISTASMSSLQMPARETEKTKTPVNPPLANNPLTGTMPISSHPALQKITIKTSAHSQASTPPTRKTPSNSAVKPKMSTGSTPGSKLKLSKPS